jgi:hypothetical protein
MNFEATNKERREMFGMLKMQMLNSEKTDMLVIAGKIDWMLFYAIDNNEEIELYYGKN